MAPLEQLRQVASLLPPSEKVSGHELADVVSAFLAVADHGEAILEAAGEGGQAVADLYHERAVQLAQDEGKAEPLKGAPVATQPPAPQGPGAIGAVTPQQVLQLVRQALSEALSAAGIAPQPPGEPPAVPQVPAHAPTEAVTPAAAPAPVADVAQATDPLATLSPEQRAAVEAYYAKQSAAAANAPAPLEATTSPAEPEGDY